MPNLLQLSQDYQLVEKAILFLQENATRQPGLKEVAAHIGMSEFHFQKVFSRWAGISPKRFLQFLTKENAKALLERTSVLSAAYQAGLSGPGRLHDLIVQTEAVTPAEYRARGAGVEIAYGFHPTPFGECLLGLSGRGICFLGFVTGERTSTLGALRANWPNSRLLPDEQHTRLVVEQIFASFGDGQLPAGELAPLRLHLRGTNFQLKVWEALLRLPSPALSSYSTLASQVGCPGSARAVGNALAHNPVALLIPCHRVLQKAGGFGNYRYGSARKQAILGWEMAKERGG